MQDKNTNSPISHRNASPETPPAALTHETIIETSEGWQQINWRELWHYRDLCYFFTVRTLKTRYAQSIFGVSWVVLQSVATVLIFTVVFGNLAQISSDGVPYAVFSFAGLVPWNYFSNALTESTGSLVRSSNMLSKVYFPRLVLPLAAVLSKLLDFGINLVLLFLMMLLFQMLPTSQVIFLPLLILIMFLSATGLGMWLTALAVQYRDVNYGVNFGIRLLLYTVPVIYPLSLIPDHFRLIYGLNPMVGVIEGFRSALLNTNPMPWDLIILGGVVSVALFLSGAMYFQRAERIFADVA